MWNATFKRCISVWPIVFSACRFDFEVRVPDDSRATKTDVVSSVRYMVGLPPENSISKGDRSWHAMPPAVAEEGEAYSTYYELLYEGRLSETRNGKKTEITDIDDRFATMERPAPLLGLHCTEVRQIGRIISDSKGMIHELTFEADFSAISPFDLGPLTIMVSDFKSCRFKTSDGDLAAGSAQPATFVMTRKRIVSDDMFCGKCGDEGLGHEVCSSDHSYDGFHTNNLHLYLGTGTFKLLFRYV